MDYTRRNNEELMKVSPFGYDKQESAYARRTPPSAPPLPIFIASILQTWNYCVSTNNS